jgi:phage replication initiation protein
MFQTSTSFEKREVLRPAELDVRGASKSPAQITDLPPVGVSVHLDWLSVTFPVSVGVEHIVHNFFGIPMDQFTRTEKPLNGYQTRYQWGAVVILADGPEEKGIHLDLSGSAVRQVESLVFGGDTNRWAEFVEKCFRFGAHFTRLDLAADQYYARVEDMLFTFDDLMASLERGDYRSYWKKFYPTFGYAKTDKGVELIGRSVYIGSKNSRCFLCVYDKKLERMAKKGEKVDGEWLRMELRFKHERADAIAALVASGGCADDFGKWFRGVLSHYLSFLDPESDGGGNVSRRAVVSWWERFLGAVEKVRLTFQKSEKGLKEKKDWLSRQVSVSLAMLREYYEEEFETEGAREFWRYIAELIQGGKCRLKDYHYNQISSWRGIADAV